MSESFMLEKPSALAEGVFTSTSLGDAQYQRYGNRILEFIQKQLHKIILEKGTYHKDDTNFWKGAGDENCRVYVKVISRDTALRWAPSHEEVMYKKDYEQFFNVNEVLVQTNDGVKITGADVGKGIYMLNHGYPSCPQNKGTPIAHNLKNAYVLMTVVLKIEGVWRTMTSYLTWAYIDQPYQLTGQIIDRMGETCLDPIRMFARKQSPVAILHNCKKDKIDAVIGASGKVFAQVAYWDGKDQEQFNRWIHDIDYNIVQLNPWLRGTGAIVKYVDGVMRKIHGHELKPYHPEKFLDLEVHANPFKPNFIKNNSNNYS